MEELKQFEAQVKSITNPSKTVILEMIKEAKGLLIKNPLDKRDILITLHNDINILVIGEPSNPAFRQAKSFMDNIVEMLR